MESKPAEEIQAIIESLEEEGELGLGLLEGQLVPWTRARVVATSGSNALVVTQEGEQVEVVGPGGHFIDRFSIVYETTRSQPLLSEKEEVVLPKCHKQPEQRWGRHSSFAEAAHRISVSIGEAIDD